MTRNLFEVLGLPFGASDEEIRAAYKKQAFRHHPDRSSAPFAATKFQELSAAYDILADPDARKDYINLATRKASSDEISRFQRQRAHIARQAKISTASMQYEMMCPTFAQGHECQDPECLFQHKVQSEQRARKVVDLQCRFFLRGQCFSGTNCPFRHTTLRLSTVFTTWRCPACRKNNPYDCWTCMECASRRQLTLPVYRPGERVRLAWPVPEVAAATEEMTLFLVQDGFSMEELERVLLGMRSVVYSGALMGTVERHFPASNCFALTLFTPDNAGVGRDSGGSTLFIAPRKALEFAEEQWKCAQCEHRNSMRAIKCLVCSAPRGDDGANNVDIAEAAAVASAFYTAHDEDEQHAPWIVAARERQEARDFRRQRRRQQREDAARRATGVQDGTAVNGSAVSGSSGVSSLSIPTAFMMFKPITSRAVQVSATGATAAGTTNGRETTTTASGNLTRIGGLIFRRIPKPQPSAGFTVSSASAAAATTSNSGLSAIDSSNSLPAASSAAISVSELSTADTTTPTSSTEAEMIKKTLSVERPLCPITNETLVVPKTGTASEAILALAVASSGAALARAFPPLPSACSAIPTAAVAAVLSVESTLRKRPRVLVPDVAAMAKRFKKAQAAPAQQPSGPSA